MTRLCFCRASTQYVLRAQLHAVNPSQSAAAPHATLPVTVLQPLPPPRSLLEEQELELKSCWCFPSGSQFPVELELDRNSIDASAPGASPIEASAWLKVRCGRLRAMLVTDYVLDCACNAEPCALRGLPLHPVLCAVVLRSTTIRQAQRVPHLIATLPLSPNLAP